MKSKIEHLIIALVIAWFLYVTLVFVYKVYIKKELPRDFDQYAPKYEIPDPVIPNYDWPNEGKG